MKDSELRGIVLRKFYEKRNDGFFQWCEVDVSDMPGGDYILRMSDQLGQLSLVDWRGVTDGGKTVGGIGQITAFGIDVVEGTAEPPVSIVIDQRQISVSQSTNVQIGEGNVQDVRIHIEKLFEAIEQSSGSPAGKSEAKSLLKRFLEHPLVTSIAGGLASSVKA